MRIELITPAHAHALSGNQITARRYASILQDLGHRVALQDGYQGTPCDLLIALHARRSAKSALRFRKHYPELPLIIVLTGTDLYRDIRTNRNARRVIEAATWLVTLQKRGRALLPTRLHAKTRVIYQSAERLPGGVERPRSYFKVSVVGHLRPEKDPFRSAVAVRQLPAESRVKVIHIGRALDRDMEKRAARETASNPRYRWLGELPHGKTRRLLASSHLVALTSRIEGSSNVLSEALVSSVPVVASRIDGLIGTLGEDYPGYFPPGNTQALTCLLQKAETDPGFYAELRSRCAQIAEILTPERERDSWKELLGEISPTKATNGGLDNFRQ